MSGKAWKTLGFFAVFVSMSSPSGATGFSEGIPEGWVCEGTCGTSPANGVVALAPGGGERYGWVTTAGSGFRNAFLPGIGGTNGSRLYSAPFSARAGDDLEFSFNYVTSDGAGFADYGWARLLDASLEPVALLFTARTRSSGNVVPGFGMPDIEANITPETVSIIGPGPAWSVLEGDSGRCYAAGCGYTGWVKSNYTIVEAGEYVLEFGVVNWADTAYQSGLAFDGVLVGGKPIDAQPDYRDVRVLVTLAADGVSLAPGSFATPPVRVDTNAATTEVEWFFETLSLQDLIDLDFSVQVIDPRAGEIRPVVERVVVRYRDLLGVEHQRMLGPLNVEVLGSALTIEVGLDRPSYVAGETFEVYTATENLGEVGVLRRVELEIQDEEGRAVVSRALPEDRFIAAGATEMAPNEVFDSSGWYAGDYRVMARVTDLESGLASVATATFRIVIPGDTGLNAAVLADRDIYQPSDEVVVTVLVFNDAPNWQAENHSLELRVHSLQGTLLWSDLYPLNTIVAGGQFERAQTFALQAAAAGTYRVSLTVRDPSGLAVATAETSFAVASTAVTGSGLTGVLTAHPAPVLRSEPLLLSAAVTNRGNADLSGVPIELLLVNPAAESEQARWSWVIDLDQGDGTALDADWRAEVPADTVLVAVLTANIGGETRLLDSTAVRVNERFISSLDVQGHGRVLVLMDGPVSDECAGITSLDVAFTPEWMPLEDARLEVQLLAGIESPAAVLSPRITDDGVLGKPIEDTVELGVEAMDPQGWLLSVSQPDSGILPRGPYRILATVSGNGFFESFESPPFAATCEDLDAYTDFGSERSEVFRFVRAQRAAEGSAHAERQFLEALLTSHGWSHTIVTDRAAFANQLRQGGYASYLLLASDVKLDNQVARELREAILTGRGIVMAGAHDHRNHHLLEIFGADVVGVHPMVSGIEPLGVSPIEVPNASFDAAGRPLRLHLNTAIPVAQYGLSAGNSRNTSAVAIHRFGFGNSVIAGFDLIGQAYRDNETGDFSRLMLSALEYVQPAQVPLRGGMTIPVSWRVFNRGQIASLSQFLEVAGGRIVDPGLAREEGPQALSRQLELAAGEADELKFWWQLPVAAEAAWITGWLDLREGVSTREYGEVTQFFPMEPVIDFARLQTLLLEAAMSGAVARQVGRDIELAVAHQSRGNTTLAIDQLLRAAERLEPVADRGALELRAAIGWLIHQLNLSP